MQITWKPVVPYLNWLLGFLLICTSVPALAQQPLIAIIIDDMGYTLQSGQKALNLPGRLTYSFLPYAPYTKLLAEQAFAEGKEVMLHAPMQALKARASEDAGVLTARMPEQVMIHRFVKQLGAVPHIAGVNNHQGSRLTQNAVRMQLLMRVLAEYTGKRLFFVDSRTTARSVAYTMAKKNALATLQRDVFLDHDTTEAAIYRQFSRLVALAKQKGFALGIAHPGRHARKVLDHVLRHLHDYGVTLVPVSRLIASRTGLNSIDRRHIVKMAAITKLQDHPINEFELF